MEFGIIKPVNNLVLDGNMCENWRKFMQSFEIFMTATGVSTKGEDIKIATFLNAIGEEALEIFNTFKLSEEEKKNYEKVVKKFEEFCLPKKNTIYERFSFYKRDQGKDEPFDMFLMDIKRLVQTCEFGCSEQEMLRDRIVSGICDKKLQKLLLQDCELDFLRAVDRCRSAENMKEKIDQKQEISSAADELKEGHQEDGRRFANNFIYNCPYCNLSHRPRNCPAYGRLCKNCLRLNHYAIVCKFKNESQSDVKGGADVC